MQTCATSSMHTRGGNRTPPWHVGNVAIRHFFAGDLVADNRLADGASVVMGSMRVFQVWPRKINHAPRYQFSRLSLHDSVVTIDAEF